VIPFHKRFYVRLSSLFLVLLLVMGTAQVLISMRIAEQRQIEVDQLVNWDLAADMVAEIEPVLAADGSITDVGSVIHYMMVLNPAIEIYLLDATGKILAFFAEPGKEVRQKSVDLGPIRAFIRGREPAPIFGDDPRNPGQRKHFSAAPISLPDGSRGYLYVVLRSTRYDTASGRLREKYLASALTRALLLAIAGVGLVGLVLFAVLTRRLQGLSRTVGAFQSGKLDQRAPDSSGDEIGELGRAFNRMADAIAASMEELKQTDSLRRELVANVSHDLRSPLTSIQGYVETLLMKEDSLDRDKRREYLQIILNDAVMLNELVHELFELSKLEARQVQPHLERFVLTELAQDVYGKYRARAEALQLELRADFPEKLLFVRGDIRMIERVVSNLIENALAHTPPGGAVALGLREREGCVQVQVTDSGSGISEEELPHIFERFFSGRGARKTSKGGSGLGLAIAQKIMELHGSRIEVESRPGQGSTFRFELPLDG
jgi:signal transduction histidine kinase